LRREKRLVEDGILPLELLRVAGEIGDALQEDLGIHRETAVGIVGHGPFAPS